MISHLSVHVVLILGIRSLIVPPLHVLVTSETMIQILKNLSNSFHHIDVIPWFVAFLKVETRISHLVNIKYRHNYAHELKLCKARSLGGKYVLGRCRRE
jgi:hypothetical protein